MGRLAPTPSGHLHLGNALAFGAAWLSIRQAGGRLLLRVEDVDRGRARADIEAAQKHDLQWLGLTWDTETPPQRDRDYSPWLEQLEPAVYRCVCTRRMVREAGGVYPGTCRTAGHESGAARLLLDERQVRFTDRRYGPRLVQASSFGDPILQRRDGLFAYPLAVVADDLVDGVTEVVRGADLLDYTGVQVVLWRALGATPPSWLHSPLVVDDQGRKLAKSQGSTELRALRDAGHTPRDVWRVVLPWLGLEGYDHVHDAVSAFDVSAGPLGPVVAQPR